MIAVPPLNYKIERRIQVLVKNNGAAIGFANISEDGEIQIKFRDIGIPNAIIELFKVGLADSLEIKANVIPAKPATKEG